MSGGEACGSALWIADVYKAECSRPAGHDGPHECLSPLLTAIAAAGIDAAHLWLRWDYRADDDDYYNAAH